MEREADLSLRSLAFCDRRAVPLCEPGWADLGEEDFLQISVFRSLGKERRGGVSLIKMKTISDLILKHAETFYST